MPRTLGLHDPERPARHSIDGGNPNPLNLDHARLATESHAIRRPHHVPRTLVSPPLPPDIGSSRDADDLISH